MQILVTGGAGFIGSHIVKQLADASHEVVVYDNFSSSSKERLTINDERLAIVQGDVRDSELLKKSLEGVDGVIHMASFIEVSESVKNPLKFAENNILGTVSLLEAMREVGVKKIVFSSSSTVYGEPETLPIYETAKTSPDNPYGATKIASEAFVQTYVKLFGFDATILRYFNPYGPGELHNPESHAIPNFIKAGIEKRPIPLYWKGEQTRDFIYVEDLARAHIAVLGDMGKTGAMGEKGECKIYNVGTGEGVKIIDIVNELSDIFGYTLEIDDLGERKGDVMANYASSKKLMEATGWKAETSLEEGLRKTVEWFKQSLPFADAKGKEGMGD